MMRGSPVRVNDTAGDNSLTPGFNPETGPQESISGLEPAIQRLTMEVTEAAESTSEKEEEQELLRLRNKPSWLHLSSYTIFLFAYFD